jgi:hypothetical protein
VCRGWRTIDSDYAHFISIVVACIEPLLAVNKSFVATANAIVDDVSTSTALRKHRCTLSRALIALTRGVGLIDQNGIPPDSDDDSEAAAEQCERALKAARVRHTSTSRGAPLTRSALIELCTPLAPTVNACAIALRDANEALTSLTRRQAQQRALGSVDAVLRLSSSTSLSPPSRDLRVKCAVAAAAARVAGLFAADDINDECSLGREARVCDDAMQQLSQCITRIGVDEASNAMQTACKSVQYALVDVGNSSTTSNNGRVADDTLFTIVGMIRQRINCRDDGEVCALFTWMLAKNVSWLELSHLCRKICEYVEHLIGRNDDVDVAYDTLDSFGDINNDVVHLVTLRTQLLASHRDVCIANAIINVTAQVLELSSDSDNNSNKNQFLIQVRVCDAPCARVSYDSLCSGEHVYAIYVLFGVSGMLICAHAYSRRKHLTSTCANRCDRRWCECAPWFENTFSIFVFQCTRLFGRFSSRSNTFVKQLDQFALRRSHQLVDLLAVDKELKRRHSRDATLLRCLRAFIDVNVDEFNIFVFR